MQAMDRSYNLYRPVCVFKQNKCKYTTNKERVKFWEDDIKHLKHLYTFEMGR